MDVLESRPEIIKLIGDVAVDQGLENYRITQVETNDKGEGFLSLIYLVSLEDATTKRKLDLAIKASFNDEKTRSEIPLQQSGENEIYFYSKVNETFKSLQKAKGVQEEINLVPLCYKTVLEDRNELLCFENLRAANFETVDTTETLDHEHVSLIFKNYGRFHAFSYALKDQYPKKFQEYAHGLKNLYLEFLDNKKTSFASNLKAFYKLANKFLIPGEDDAVIEKFRKYQGDNSINTFANIATEKNDFFCITQGDCWSNNMMFKYEILNGDKKLIDMRILDLQFSKIGSPVCDLSYCLYSGGSKEVFDNLEEYLKLYHESLSVFLRKLGSDPEKLFPYNVLKDHWRKYSKFGMFMGLMIIKMKVTDKKDIFDFSDGLESEDMTEKFINTAFNEEVYQKRIRELLHHMAEVEAL